MLNIAFFLTNYFYGSLWNAQMSENVRNHWSKERTFIKFSRMWQLTMKLVRRPIFTVVIERMISENLYANFKQLLKTQSWSYPFQNIMSTALLFFTQFSIYFLFPIFSLWLTVQKVTFCLKPQCAIFQCVNIDSKTVIISLLRTCCPVKWDAIVNFFLLILQYRIIANSF